MTPASKTGASIGYTDYSYYPFGIKIMLAKNSAEIASAFKSIRHAATDSAHVFGLTHCHYMRC